MTVTKWGLATLSVAVVVGLSGTADAQVRHVQKPHRGAAGHGETLGGWVYLDNAGPLRLLDTQIGQFYISPGDSEALINRAYPVDANPPSLRQTYNLRWRKMQEFRR
ncbi:hypothetical protein [Microvirga sp. Mcv34]|uniref:hypothetical protein n=1 Tax=Microvirga sp. Mcv34 TaxID=2926016 RepID=UPI0021C898F0|nr:hypothetical protein [Microvirga sp. Mcv34]